MLREFCIAHEISYGNIISMGETFSRCYRRRIHQQTYVTNSTVLASAMCAPVVGNAEHFFQLRSNQSRGHRFQLYKQFSSSNTRSSFFTQRV